MDFARDSRGQAIGIVRFLASLGVGAILIWVLAEVTGGMFTHVKGQTASDSAAAQGTTYLQELVNAAPLVFSMTAFFGLIAYSVYARVVS